MKDGRQFLRQGSRLLIPFGLPKQLWLRAAFNLWMLPWALVLLLLSAGCGSSGQQRDRRPPNIVLITIDDLGWADLGCYGSRYYETPNLDRLASQGMRFTQAYASAAICSPTRAALLTGRAPARTGITDWIRARFQGGEIPADKTYRLSYAGGPDDSLLCPVNPLWMELEEITIAEELRKQGYATGHIGKWHLGAEDWYPEKQGFEVNIGGSDYGQPPSYFDPYENPRAKGIYNLPPRKKGEHLSDRLADEAVGFIIAHRDDRFFLNMADYAVHTPIQGRPDLVEKYRRKPADGRQDNPEYAALVEGMDMLVGRIMHTLDSLDLSSNTLLIFTSDNGGLSRVTDNSPLRSGKGYPYEGGIRIPLIVRYPGKIPAGSTSDLPVISHDWFPTLCDIAGIPATTTVARDGMSLKEHLFYGDRSAREALHWHFPHYRQKDIMPYSVIRKGEWKLIKQYQGKKFQLFDLSADPYETRDLAGSRADKVRELGADLNRWLEKTGAALPKPNPDYSGR